MIVKMKLIIIFLDILIFLDQIEIVQLFVFSSTGLFSTLKHIRLVASIESKLSAFSKEI